MSEKEFDHVTDALKTIINGRVVPWTVAKKALEQHRRKAFNTSLTKADEKSITENGTGEHDDSEADTPVVLKETLEELKSENENLVTKLKKMQNIVAVNDEDITKFKRKHGVIIQESVRLREENIKLQKKVSSLYEKTSQASRSLNVEDEVKPDSSEKGSVHNDMLKIENEKLKAQTDQTEKPLAIKKEEIKEFVRKQGILIKEKEEIQRNCQRLEEEYSKLKNKVASLNDMNSQKISRTLKTVDKSTMVENLHFESSRALEKQKEENQKLLEKIRKLETENSELSTRFQVLASQKLTSGNPDIADLSDVYRPTNLSDQFRQMYDDEWTHAYEDLEKQKLTDEIKIIEFLVNILKAIESFCEDAAGQQLVRLQQLIVDEFCYPKFQHKSGSVVAGQHRAECTTTQTEIANKALKELRKSLGIISSGPLIQVFHKVYMSDFNCKEEMFTPGINSFIIEGVKLVWMMKMQDPPMQFVWASNGETINKNRFTHYTRSGDTVKYCVWPAVALHKDGPLMTKGIVQA